MKAMLLCAGYGTRLGPLTLEWPKPMLPVEGDRPLLAYLLSHLRAHGFCEVALNLHFKPEVIREWFGDGSRWRMQLTYSWEEQLLGTAGGLKQCAGFFKREDAFLVQYGDILTDHDFGSLLEMHRSRRALATLLVHPRARSNSVIGIDARGRITSFLERPTDAERQGQESPWVNSGVCVCSPELFEYLPARQPSDLPRDVFLPLVSTGRLYAMPLAGYRCAIDSTERLLEARAAVAAGQCRIQPLARGHGDGQSPGEGNRTRASTSIEIPRRGRTE